MGILKREAGADFAKHFIMFCKLCFRPHISSFYSIVALKVAKSKRKLKCQHWEKAKIGINMENGVLCKEYGNII